MTRDRERLQQGGRLVQLMREFLSHELIVVYSQDDNDEHRLGIFCALIPNARAEESLRHPEWDLMIGHGAPGAIRYGSGEGTRTEYFRYGSDDGIEPLILWRHFHGLREKYVEISEEFRLFHDLFHDRKTDQFYKFDEAGNEQLVATIEPHSVRIRLLEIRQFLAVREMHLALFIDAVESSSFSLKDLDLESGGQDQTQGLVVFGLHNGDYRGLGLSDNKAFSRLLGKRLIPPLPKEKSGFWGFGEPEPRKFVDFIIGVDENGNDVMNTSSEGELSNYFGANPGRPHYLTPVFFRKAVLDKY